MRRVVRKPDAVVVVATRLALRPARRRALPHAVLRAVAKANVTSRRLFPLLAWLDPMNHQ
jgi:uncharacterized membrane protein